MNSSRKRGINEARRKERRERNTELKRSKKE